MGTPVYTLGEASQWYRLPRSLPRRSASLLPWVILLCDQQSVCPVGELQRASGLTRQGCGRALVPLVEAGMLHRVPRKRLRLLGLTGSHVEIVWGRILGGSWVNCLTCPRPVKSVPGARYCPTCQATQARLDRDWKRIAFERHVQGVSRLDDRGRPLPESESSIAYSIHRATGQPLYTRHRSDDSADESTQDARTGVVNFMLAQGWFTSRSWGAAIRNFNAGDTE